MSTNDRDEAAKGLLMEEGGQRDGAASTYPSQRPFVAIQPALAAVQQPQQHHSPLTIFLVVAFYWVVSLAVVFLNKFILSSKEYSFPYPLFVTWYQLVVALLLLYLFGALGERLRRNTLGTSDSILGTLLTLIPPYEFRQDLAMQVLPLSLIYVGMLALNNLCLQYVEVTFYQVARSLSILFNILFTFTILKQTTSLAAVGSCVIVFIGFVLGSAGEVNFSWIGIIYGVGSSAFVALYGIYVKKALQAMDNDQWRLLHYNTTLAVIILFPLVWISGELRFWYEVTFLHHFSFWNYMTITAITGFLINIAIFVQIKYTTPLTNTISGTAKACAQTLIAWIVFENTITVMNGYGILLSLVGSGLYSYVRYKEMVRR